MSDDSIMSQIQAAIETLQAGDRLEARADFARIWSTIKHDPSPLHECTLAHFMADTQDSVQDELEWDQRALAAAMRCSDSDARKHHDSLSIAAFMPSLHLNLGDDFLRIGDRAACEQHLKAGLAATADLPDTPYASMIRGGLDRLAMRLRSVV